jgi:hypothetical protein
MSPANTKGDGMSVSTAIIRWEQPPQVRRGRQKYDVSAILAQLGAKPESWALVAEGGSVPTLRKHLQEAGCEVQGSDTSDRTKQKLFARWIPPVKNTGSAKAA